MLSALTNKQWVTDHLKKVLEHIDESRRDPALEAAPDKLTEAGRTDYADVRQDVAASLKTLQAETRKDTGLEAQAQSDEEPGGDADYMGKDAVVSNLQSATEFVHQQRLLKAGFPKLQGDAKLEAFDPFGESDVGWISSLVAMGIRKFKDRHEWNDTPAPEIKLTDGARVILFADWGSGIERAQKITELARGYIEQSQKENQMAAVIHLGDVYYSGYDWEYYKRFFPYWPVRQDEADKIPSISLNGNHDMYAGGYGYYDVLLKEKRFAPWHQNSSMVLLTNRNWRILGLDTAYEDHGLQGSQTDWVCNQAALAKAAGQKLMLLSHHQPFSLYEPPGADCILRTKINPIISQTGVHTWFWGHEHRCVLYDTFEGTRNGRCIGHAGVPVYLWKQLTAAPGQPRPRYEYRDAIRHYWGLEKFSVFGFLVLDFIGAEIRVRYVNEFGIEHHEERIT